MYDHISYVYIYISRERESETEMCTTECFILHPRPQAPARLKYNTRSLGTHTSFRALGPTYIHAHTCSCFGGF